MTTNKTIKLGSKSGAQGIYECQVVEPPALRGLRRVAARRAGIPGEYDGSVDSYNRLTRFEKVIHNEELKRLVVQYAPMLNAPESRRRSNTVKTTGKKKNLILNQGLNKMLGSSPINWANFSAYCAVGVGTTPVVTDSGSVTATTSGSSTTVAASSSFFTGEMVGMVFNADDGQNGVIVSESGTSCVLNNPINLAAPTLFAVWAVQQTGLASEVKRTSTYLTGAGNCGTTFVGPVITYKRTYDFSIEVAPQNYTELGWSNASSSANNLNARTLITGGSVTVLIGQQLRVIYELEITVSPSVSTPGTWNISGWPVSPSTTVDGDYMFCDPSTNGMPNVDTSGVAGYGGNHPYVRGSSSPWGELCTGSTLPSFGNQFSKGTSSQSSTASFQSYVNDSFVLGSTYHWVVGSGNRSDWRAILIGGGGGFAFVFDEAQTKDNVHTLTVNYTMTIGRTLVNP